MNQMDVYKRMLSQKELYEKNKESIASNEREINELQKKNEELFKQIRRLEEQLKQAKRITSYLIGYGNNKRNIKNLTEQLEEMRKQFNANKKSSDLLQDSIKVMITENEELETSIKSIPECFSKNEEGVVVIKSKGARNPITIYERDFSEHPEKYLMVHCTDFYPENHRILSNYDGNKINEIEVKFDGVTKTCKALSHRHTVHYTINSGVQSTGDGAGNWSNPSYIIIDPMKYHINDDIKLFNPSDSYNFGSVDLSTDAILMVREDLLATLDPKVFRDYTVIGYSGNHYNCILNYIQSMGYKTLVTDPNIALHSKSDEMRLEHGLDYRDLCLNYTTGKLIDKNSDVKITIDELVDLYNVWLKQGDEVERINSSLVSDELYHFIVRTGLYRNEDDTFSFYPDDVVYDHITGKKDVDMNAIKSIADYIEMMRELKDSEEIELDDEILLSMKISDMNDFQNHQYVKRAIEIFEQMAEENNMADFNSSLVADLKVLGDRLSFNYMNFKGTRNLIDCFDDFDCEFGDIGFSEVNFYSINTKSDMTFKEFITIYKSALEKAKTYEENNDFGGPKV